MIRRVARAYASAFRGLSREVWILAAVAFVNRSGMMVLPFLLLYLTTQHGYAAAEAGAIVSLYALGGVAGTELGGRLTDRLGHRAVMLTALSLHGVLLLGFGRLQSPSAIAVGAAVLGLVAESFRPANAVAFAANSDEETRPRAFGLHRLAINLGVAIGPVAGGFLAEVDYSWLFLVDGTTCIVAVLLLLALLPRGEEDEAPSEQEAREPGASPYRDRAFVAFLGLLFLQGVVFFQFLSTLPLFLREQRGLTESVIGAVLGVNAVTIALFEMVLIQAVQRRNPLRIAAVAGALCGVGFGLVAFAWSVWALVGTVLVWTLGEMLSLPMTETWVARRAADRNRGRYLASYALAFNAAGVAAPLAGTAVYEGMGPNVVWYFAFVLGAVQLVGFWRLSHRA